MSTKRVEVIHDRNLIISVYAGHFAEITHYLLEPTVTVALTG